MRRVVGALAAACVFAVPNVAYAQTGALPVLGFQMAGDPLSAIDQSAAALGSVGVDGIYLAGNGKSVGTPSSTLTAQLARAHQDGVKGVLVLANWSGSGFSETVVYRLVSSSSNRAAVERSLAKTVTSQGWDGINIDFEGMTSRDTAGVVSFLRELRAALPASASLSIDVYNDSSVAAFTSHGFDLAGFAPSVDSAVVMAYDEHSQWTPNTPGPIGELSWQQAGLQTVVSQIPASKVVLGVAGYGYAWRPSGVVRLSDAQARALCAQYGVTPTWMSTQGEWTARLSDGSTLWWSDAQSFAARRTLAGQFGLSGLSVWDLGLSDPIT